MTKLHHILASSLLVLALAVALTSCKGGDAPGIDIEQHPIAFASVAAEEEAITRAATPLARDFVVYGYKNVGGSEQVVFDGYAVKYQAGSANTSEDNSHGYYYVHGDQTIKYWDFSASEYHFWGVYRATPDRATFSGEHHNVLTIPAVPLRVGEPAPDDDVLYSSLVDRNPVSTDVVQLRFKRPYAKLRIQFYTSIPLEADDQIELTGIRFAPDPEAVDPQMNKVYGQGDVLVTYPLVTDGCTGDAHESVTVDNLDQPQRALLFDDVTLTATLGITSNTAVTAPIDEDEGFRLDDMPGASLMPASSRAGEETSETRAGEVPGRKYYYYPLPTDELHQNPAFTLTVSVDDEVKSAVVPANFMQWKTNFLYTYIFKITEAGKELEFIDVKIDPWKFGGSQEEEWRNW